MITLLLVSNYVIPITLGLFSCLRRKGFEINHIFLFTGGYIFYWILPISIGVTGGLSKIPLMISWQILFNSIAPWRLEVYLIITLVSYLCFYSGSALGSRMRVNLKWGPSTYKLSAKTLKLLFVFPVFFLVYYIMKFHSELFTGYVNSLNTTSQKGGFVSLSLVMLSMVVIGMLITKSKYADVGFGRLLLANKMMYVYFITSLLVMSLGGRLYFLSGIMMLVVYRTVYFRRLKISSMGVLVATGFVLMGLIGISRIGHHDFNVQSVVYNLLSESLYTGFSLTFFLGHSTIVALSYPRFLISDFINVIPSAILPGKTQLYVDPATFGYTVYNPLGAMNSFMSFMMNFGYVGSFIFILLLGMCLGAMRQRAQSVLSITSYVMISGWLAFTFFRDPFSVSLVKNIFEYAILVPWILVGLVRVISESVSGRVLHAEDPSESMAVDKQY